MNLIELKLKNGKTYQGEYTIVLDNSGDFSAEIEGIRVRVPYTEIQSMVFPEPNLKPEIQDAVIRAAVSYSDFVYNSEIGSDRTFPKSTHAILGMEGEAGECVDIVKKAFFQGHKFDPDHFLNELGDIAWYFMLYINENDMDIDDIFGSIRRVNVRPIISSTSLASNLIDKVVMLNRHITNLSKDTNKNDLHSYIDVKNSLDNLAAEFNRDLPDIFNINRIKITKRYPNGFNTNDSVNRSQSDK